ncbi:DUF6185 family protein [Streptomyces sp. NBC_01006]|uniref:DUF6185 family protein n=1 Tax=Streptomyces sp. NBC_01006 TaxID=2903716 RepID=UPI00386FFC00|nr:DUF6185 family protein [Streptomyces sp. NBC_01006]
MLHLRPHMLLFVLVLLLSLLLLSPVYAADPPRGHSCDPDRLAGAKVTTSAEFVHRGQDNSVLTSVADIKIPAGWERTPDLLLDTHAPLYRDALRCLLGKGATVQAYLRGKPYEDSEWRLKPLSVKLSGAWVAVHYEAVNWVQGLDTYDVGLWTLTAGKDEWEIRLRAPPSLAKATWENVRVRLGGPAAMSAWPPPTFGGDRTELTWHNRTQIAIPGVPDVAFRPPAAQQWAALTQTDGDAWQALGVFGASGAFSGVATAVLAFVAGRRLRRGMGRRPLPAEKEALSGLCSWSLVLTLITLVAYMGDDLYRLLQDQIGWKGEYEATVDLFSALFIGLVLCFFGRLKRWLLVVVCALAACTAALCVAAEMSPSGLLPTSDVEIRGTGLGLAVLLDSLPVFLCCLGMVASGQRLLILGGRGLSQGAQVWVAAGTTAMAMLWAFVSLDRSWERGSWLNDAVPAPFGSPWVTTYDTWWWWFSANALPALADIALFLTPLALVGALRVCRAEQHEADSFTPNAAEKSVFVIFFAIVVVPNFAWYFGFSGYITTLILAIAAAWALLAMGLSKSVLEQPTESNSPLGKVISRTDRSQWMRLARHYRELQARLHHPGSGSAAEQSASQEAVEREIDQLDQCLPEGVRPIDLPFAIGPMATWWGNACRCALIACIIGLPATGLMYWIDFVRGDSWGVMAENPTGFLLAVLDVIYWHMTWVGGGFFLGGLWRDLPGRHGPTKAVYVSVAFGVPVGFHQLIAQITGDAMQGTIAAIAAFASVMTCTGLVMDLQTFQSERRYWPSNAGLVLYVYQMRFASVAFCLAQLVALATIWKAFKEGGPTPPPSHR